MQPTRRNYGYPNLIFSSFLASQSLTLVSQSINLSRLKTDATDAPVAIVPFTIIMSPLASGLLSYAPNLPVLPFHD
jgi:hypothetical protein